MKYIKVHIVAIIFACNISYANFFPVCGYACEQLYQADSCYLNTVLFWWHADDYIDSLFMVAENLGMKIILGKAQRPNLFDITGISGSQRSVYQAESNAFVHVRGKRVYDSEAHNDTACITHSSKPGWLQKDLWVNERYRFPTEKLQYYACFRLKTNNNIGTYPVCTLFVRRKENGKIFPIAHRSITPQSFTETGVYDTFAVLFELKKNEVNSMDYAIWYTGTNDSLYSDEVEVLDATAYKLKNGVYNKDIETVASYYSEKPAMYRYYLWDEPTIHQLWASGKVNYLLRKVNTEIGGVQAMNHANLFSSYFDLVDSDELLVDFYPFNGRSNYFERTPLDSGKLFQNKLDELCNFLSKARISVKSYNKNFWYIPQAFGQAITDRSYTWDSVWNVRIPLVHEGWWREPTSREFSCTIWLALAYGAKGIVYYRYQSRPEKYDLGKYNYHDHHWIVGLTDPSGSVKRPLWYVVQNLNIEVVKISDILINAETDTVFKSNTIPSNCYITSINDSLVQVGLFKKENEDYILMVNRHCLPQDIISLSLQIRYPKRVRILNCGTGENISPYDQSNDLYTFKFEFNPGEGKLFKLVTTRW